MIKTIFFDFGGVIIKTPNQRWIKRWKHLLGLNNHPEVLALIENPHESPLMKDICLGKTPEDYIWSLMAEQWHVKPNLIAFFRRQLSSRKHLNQRVIKLMAELRGRYQTAILSNAGDQTRHLMEGTYQLHQYVDEIIISAEEGAIKPDHRIYEIAVARMGTEPETSLLLDDYLPNILGARDFGMHAVQYLNDHQAITMVRSQLNGRY